MAQSLQSFIGGNDFRQDPRSPQSWLVFWGMSFLILVSISNYTAQVTLFNVVMADTGELQSLRDGIDRGYTFCGWASLKDPIERTYPEIAGLYIGTRRSNFPSWRGEQPHTT